MSDSERTCPNCGYMLEEDDSVCLECGYDLDEELNYDDEA